MRQQTGDPVGFIVEIEGRAGILVLGHRAGKAPFDLFKPCFQVPLVQPFDLAWLHRPQLLLSFLQACTCVRFPRRSSPAALPEVAGAQASGDLLASPESADMRGNDQARSIGSAAAV